jgi:cytochrome b561
MSSEGCEQVMNTTNKVTTSRLKNTASAYGWLAIALHWLMAAAIGFMFGLGLYMVELSYYDAWYRGALDLHKSVGICLLFVWLLRLFWRMVNEKPDPIGRAMEQKAAHWVHLLLYLIPLALMVSGYLISTADGRAIEVFAQFQIPALPWSIEQQEDLAGEVHESLAWILMGLVALHALAAVKHQLIDKDATLMRMIRPR